MTAERSDWSAHLAGYEAGGPAAVRAHLVFSHRERLRQLGLDGPALDGQSVALVHRRIHQPDSQPRSEP